MTEADIVWEFRQITALEEEIRTGKPASQSQTFVDDSYSEYIKSLGISPEMMEAQGLTSHVQ
jgi:hypothetical protein